MKELRNYDFFINFENVKLSRLLPSKLIDYAIANRPILSINTSKLNTQCISEFFQGNYERRLEINRAQRVSDLKNRLRSFADQDNEAPDIDSIERELLKEWDRIVELAASSIVDG